MVFGREPAFWIGLIGSILIALFGTFAEHGLVGADTQQTVVNLVGVLTPLITGIVIRFFVSPAAKVGL